MVLVLAPEQKTTFNSKPGDAREWSRLARVTRREDLIETLLVSAEACGNMDTKSAVLELKL